MDQQDKNHLTVFFLITTGLSLDGDFLFLPCFSCIVVEFVYVVLVMTFRLGFACLWCACNFMWGVGILCNLFLSSLTKLDTFLNICTHFYHASFNHSKTVKSPAVIGIFTLNSFHSYMICLYDIVLPVFSIFQIDSHYSAINVPIFFPSLIASILLCSGITDICPNNYCSTWTFVLCENMCHCLVSLLG
ncbi:hypothetical protein FOCC_FOCC005424, partial [Frankliniella occidentalis]